MPFRRALRNSVLFTLALASPGLTAPPVFAQAGDPYIAEVIRKGTAREAENGFCDTAPWPVERSAADTGNFYEQSAPGAWKTFKDTYSGSIPYCAYILINNVTHPRNGGRCVRAQMWWCLYGQQCHFRRYRGCRAATGSYRWDN
jgi:hypothetical protein